MSFNPTLDVFPRFEFAGFRFDLGHAPFDLSSPRDFGVRAIWSVQAREKFRRDFRTSIGIQPQASARTIRADRVISQSYRAGSSLNKTNDVNDYAALASTAARQAGKRRP